MDTIKHKESVYVEDPTLYYKKTRTVAPPETNIGIDIQSQFMDNIVQAGLASTLDMAKLQSFTQISQNRDTIYQLLDTMAEDPTISAALEIYAEDSTETNEQGKIVWCESAEPDVTRFVTFLLETLNIDKNIYRWAHCLCKYGDVYVRLFKESEIEDDALFNKDEKKKKPLKEDVKLSIQDKTDKISTYIEMVSNPAEMFELTRYGKSCGYIKADVLPVQQKVDRLTTSYFRYQFKEKDVTVFEATNFVHACLEDNESRVPEEVDIFLNDTNTREKEKADITYTVRRGQPIFYNAFKVWRCLMLLENSILLNRITKSSILRIIGVEVGDMDKTQVGPHLMNIKQLIEQKAAFDVGQSMDEYTNPAPIENNVYVPTHNGIGAISTQQVGGDVDVKSLADLDYFKDRFYTALRIPKQYLGDTDDATGFNGGTALSIISNRYAKMIKRIQNSLILMVTDIVNLIIIERGLDSYINKFQIHMLPPTTEEEATRRDNTSSEVQLTRDIMDLLSDIENAATKLEILKSLLSGIITDPEVLQLIQDEIDNLKENPQASNSEDDDNEFSPGGSTPFGGSDDFDMNVDLDLNDKSDQDQSPEMDQENSDEMILPTPNELNADIDFSDNTAEI